MTPAQALDLAKDVLLSYGHHQIGCCRPLGPEFECDCGYSGYLKVLGMDEKYLGAQEQTTTSDNANTLIWDFPL